MAPLMMGQPLLRTDLSRTSDLSRLVSLLRLFIFISQSASSRFSVRAPHMFPRTADSGWGLTRPPATSEGDPAPSWRGFLAVDEGSLAVNEAFYRQYFAPVPSVRKAPPPTVPPEATHPQLSGPLSWRVVSEWLVPLVGALVTLVTLV